VEGATVVSSLDSSRKAIALTEENIALNQFQGEHHAILADAMEYMKALPIDYDIIVLDPPAFAKHRDKKHQAIQGYKRLNAHAIRQIKSGGMLMTFSCSQVIDKVLFTNTVISAAIEAKRNVRIYISSTNPLTTPSMLFTLKGNI
jgi:23S rRNA (cytosine1962-C5)-methyltransferase